MWIENKLAKSLKFKWPYSRTHVYNFHTEKEKKQPQGQLVTLHNAISYIQ